MKTSTILLAVASSIVLAVAPARRLAGQSDLPADGHWSCFSGYENDPIYVTPVWDARAALDDVQSAFKQFLSTKYSYKGRVSCGRADMGKSTLAGLQAGKEQEQAQWRKNGKTIVQTGWTNGSGGAASPAAGQPASNPPTQPGGGAKPAASGQNVTQYEVCRMLGRGDGLRGTTGIPVYFSGIMQRGKFDDQDFIKGFAAYMAKQYGTPPTRTPECAAYPSQTEAQKGIDGWMAESKINKYVQTGWTLAP
jgi:hypothetical protein